MINCLIIRNRFCSCVIKPTTLLIAADQVYINLSLKMFVQLFFELKPNLSTSLIKMQKVLSNVSNVC